MLEVLIAAEVLHVWVFEKPAHDVLVALVIEVLEVLEANHKARECDKEMSPAD
jgi:hypothetical protein